MTHDYAALPSGPLAPGAVLATVTEKGIAELDLDSPALSVMTDFKRIPAATVEPGASVDEANRFMMLRGVRSLIVIEAGREVAGIITATDILGEEPVKVALERGIQHSDVLVRDVMTPAERMEALRLEDLASAKIGHVVAALAAAGRQHALVVEGNASTVRGIFSLTHIASVLGIAIDVQSVARTFAEVKEALR